MAEPLPPRDPAETAYHPSGEARAPVTLTGDDLVFPEGAEPSDDAPTIISRNVPRPNGSSAEHPAPGSLRGRSLAHFELIEPIGVGGMAAVIRARDKQLDRPVALKILPPEMAVDPENVRRFHQEARAAAKLDHENIARVFFCGEDQRLHFIAFEFVEGVNLRTLLERRGRLPIPEAIRYMLQIASGLAHAAERGVVHRDIKPSNIIISPNGRAKLVDMGLARNMGPQSDRDLTQSGVTLGTFDYIAPEQAMDPREADVRSDIYSLGCTFYHTLTGQPPVPEGTAAKKLHHHQHVSPVDPRQLNPAIPDDVAAILQRMMTKDPKDRYQRAEHLVQHLIQVYQKLGGVADMPEGVLFVDAPLPAPPRKRPLLMAAVGAGLLAVFLVALSFAPGRSGKPHLPVVSTVPDVQAQPVKEGPSPRDKKLPEAPQPKTQAPSEGPRVVQTEQQLNEALADPAPYLEVELDSAPGQPFKIERGVVLPSKGERVRVLRPKNPKQPAVVRFSPKVTADAQDPWGGVRLDGGSATFEDLHFEVEVDLGTDPKVAAPQTLLAAVLAKGASQVTFKRCSFSQPGAPLEALIARPELVPVASVAVWKPSRPRGAKTAVILDECYFQRGQAALSVLGGAHVRSTNCAFGPHVALVHVRGDENVTLEMRDVSALLSYGPAFRLDGGAACQINVQKSIFSCPQQLGDRPDLIRQTSSQKQTAHFFGQRNCYHGLNAFYQGANATGSWETYRTNLLAKGESDEGSFDLPPAESPWASLTVARAEETPLAFQVSSNQPRLWSSAGDGGRSLPIGVQKCLGQQVADPQLIAKAAPPEPTPPRKSNEKVVDPLGSRGAYHTLGAAVSDAADGDVILIKHTGLMEILPITLQKVGQKLTIRPEGAHRPVLTLAAKTVESEAALFTLYHGQLRFEKIAFLLRPDRPDFRSQTVLQLGGNGQASFTDCVLTLDLPENRTASLCAITLLEARDAMKMAMPEPKGATEARPEIRLERCLVRGDGDLLAVRPSRPFALTLDGTLAALTGAVVNVEGKGAEAMTGSSQVTLRRATTFLQEGLVCLRSKSGKGLVFTQVKADECLFASAGGRPLIHIEGPDNAEQMKGVFGWRGSQNTYAGYDTLVEQQPAGEGGRPLRYDQEQWKSFSNESDPDPRFVQVKLALPPPADRPLSQAAPDEFRATKSEPPVDLRNCGADLEQLPRPPALDRTPPAMPAVPDGRSTEEAEAGGS